ICWGAVIGRWPCDLGRLGERRGTRRRRDRWSTPADGVVGRQADGHDHDTEPLDTRVSEFSLVTIPGTQGTGRVLAVHTCNPWPPALDDFRNRLKLGEISSCGVV